MMLFKNIPSIDLHGMDREYAKIVVREFIDDSTKMKEKNILIIHGIGEGIVRKAVYEELKRNKKVKEYKQDNFNPGCTIVTLKEVIR